MRNQNKKSGFTLIEILIVMGIIGILATVVIVAVNPARQFAQARDTQRVSNINTILNAVSQRIADHKGVFEEGCDEGAIPATDTMVSTDAYDIYNCLIPTYISVIPVDPKTGSYDPITNTYNTGYTIRKNGLNGRIVVSAPSGEVNGAITVLR